jgi:hypothetical protein
MVAGAKFIDSTKGGFACLRKDIQFRTQFFNALNHASRVTPGRDITRPRDIQFGLKFYFRRMPESANNLSRPDHEGAVRQC